MGSKSFLGEFEQMVLLAILQCGDRAFGPAISAELETRARRSVSRGALYSALRRLTKKGYLRWHLEPPTPERGGHAARRFEVTDEGVRALRSCRAALLNLWTGLEDVLGGSSG
jgi:PadR family transcriptional regulator PadR